MWAVQGTDVLYVHQHGDVTVNGSGIDSGVDSQVQASDNELAMVVQDEFINGLQHLENISNILPLELVMFGTGFSSGLLLMREYTLGCKMCPFILRVPVSTYLILVRSLLVVALCC